MTPHRWQIQDRRLDLAITTLLIGIVTAAILAFAV